MPFDGAGSFSLLNDFSDDRDLGRPNSLIDADKFDAEMANIKAGLELALLRDGQNEPTDDIPMGGFSFTGMRAAALGDEPAIASQVSSGSFDWIGTSGGSANAQTGTLSFAPTLASGVRIKGIAGFTNTGATTFRLNSGATVAVKRSDGTDLKAGDITAGRPFEIIHNGTNWILVSALTVDGRGLKMFLLSSVGVSGSTITASGPSDFQTLVAGQQFLLPMSANAGATPTLAINSGTAYQVRTLGAVALGATALQSGYTYHLYFDGTYFRVMSSLDGVTITSDSLASLGDVSVSSPSNGDVLSYDTGSGSWVNVPIADGSVSGASDVTLSGLAANDILKWDGSAWVNLTIAEILGYTPQDAAGYTASDVLTKIKTVDGASSGLDADLLDGQEGAYYLAASSYTAADVKTKLLTVDGTGSGVDADLLDGQHGSYYLPVSSYTAADVLAKLLTVDGASSGIDADLLDGQEGAYYLAASSYTASDVLTKIKTVDGPGSGLDADLLDGQDSSYYTAIAARLGYTPFNAAGGTVSGSVNVTGTVTAAAFSGPLPGSSAVITGGSVADSGVQSSLNTRLALNISGTTFYIPCSTSTF